jgi:hypothetical protein
MHFSSFSALRDSGFFLVSVHIKFPPDSKHGTVFKVTPDIVKMLSEAGL